MDPGTKDFMRTIERAIEWGKPCLMENVLEQLDPSLEPILAKNLMKAGAGWSIKIGDNTLDYNMNFKFMMTTKLSNPHYTPEISTKTTIVNFIVVEEGLTNQLLGTVVLKEEARLEEVEKAKFKIDELHKNYYALQSSQKAAEAGPAKEVEQKKEMRLNRSKQHAYAFTGLYRP